MPLLSTSGADCAQGYGFGIGQAGVLTTYTFPSGSSTWTAPTGVTNLVSAVGKGSDGRAAAWRFETPSVFIGDACFAGTSLGPTLAWSTVLGQLDSMFAAANAITTLPVGQTATLQYSYAYLWCNNTNEWLLGSAFSSTGLWRRNGTLSQSYGFTGNVPTNGGSQIYGPTSGGSMEFYDTGANGVATTGFGLTFPGGTSSIPAAPTTTFTNVAVVPGTTYTISNSGSLTITYYV